MGVSGFRIGFLAAPPRPKMAHEGTKHAPLFHALFPVARFVLLRAPKVRTIAVASISSGGRSAVRTIALSSLGTSIRQFPLSNVLDCPPT